MFFFLNHIFMCSFSNSTPGSCLIIMNQILSFSSWLGFTLKERYWKLLWLPSNETKDFAWPLPNIIYIIEDAWICVHVQAERSYWGSNRADEDWLVVCRENQRINLLYLSFQCMINSFKFFKLSKKLLLSLHHSQP